MNERRNSLWSVLNKRIEIPPKQLRRFRNCFLSALVLLLIFGTYAVGCFDSKETQVNKWLKFHHLAQLPQSAANIMYYQWNGLFTGETYMRVELPSNDLAAFVDQSPGLSRGKKEIFNDPLSGHAVRTAAGEAMRKAILAHVEEMRKAGR